MLKKFFILGILMSTITFTGCSFAANQPVVIRNGDDFERVLDNYLYKKSPDDLNAIAKYLSTSNLLSQKTAKSPMRGFFIGVKHDNPAAFNRLLKTTTSQEFRRTLNSANEFSTDLEAFLDNKINYYPESGAFLDMMWGYFYATGDARVTNKMCQVIKTNGKNSLVQSAAKWSYASNMKKFPTKIKGCK